MEANAVVFTGPNQVAWQKINCPEPGAEDVVELHHSWISNGTEGSFLRGERLSGDVAWRPGDPAPFPMVAGYQKVGRVRQAYLPAMVRGGHVVIAGFFRLSGDVNLQTSLQAFRNFELSFDLVSGATRERLEATMAWVADGRLDTLGCLTHRFPVERAAEAWRIIATKSEPVLGVVLDWPASRGAA